MSSQNSINNTVKNNDFVVNLDAAGSSSISSVIHSDNTNSASHAELRCETGGASGGDPNIYFNIPSGSDYSLGIDNSTSDAFTITDGTTPSSGNNFFRLYATGNRRLEKTPAFFACRTTTASNVTGDGTTYTLVTEQTNFDQNSDYDNTSTFTAPVTGKYFLRLGNDTRSWGAQTDSVSQIVTSNQTYNFLYHGNIANNITNIFEEAAVLTDMDAGDTYHITTKVSGGTKTIGVSGIANISGYLAV